jgi:hypothetical protein
MMGTRFTGKNDLVWGIFKGGEPLEKENLFFPRIEMEKSEEPAPVPKKPRTNHYRQRMFPRHGSSGRQTLS